MIFHHPHRKLERAIGYRFWRTRLLRQALTHPSLRHEVDGRQPDNQRLEFLGDAALGLAAAVWLYREQPGSTEGDLTQVRSQITSTKALAAIANTIRLGEHLYLGKGESNSGGRERPSILADALEAVIGAAFLDGGHRAVMRIFRTIFLPALRAVEASNEVENPKGELQSWAQRAGGGPLQYHIVSERGPAHQRWYIIDVLHRDRALGRGEGANKRDAGIAAARAALEAITNDNK